MSIPSDNISIDGEFAWLVKTPFDPTFPGVEPLDRPCDRCHGDGRMLEDDHSRPPCADCDGTGRHTFDIEVDGAPDSGFIEPYRVHVIEVLPIVVGVCPDKTNAPHRRAHVHLAEPSDDDQGASGICHENCDLVFDSPWKAKNAARLPSAAAPGMWAVELAVHKEET